MTDLTLFSSPRACSLACHIALEESGLDYDLHRVRIRNGEHRGADYLAINPWGKIPALRTGDIPREAWRLHRYLTPRYEAWARARIASKRAADIHYLDVPATEWPLYGCVFYLWGTEHLQAAYEKDPGLTPEPPVEFARDTIEACKDLLLDPVHHTWVKKHWGDDYMHQENVFFRSLRRWNVPDKVDHLIAITFGNCWNR